MLRADAVNRHLGLTVTQATSKALERKSPSEACVFGEPGLDSFFFLHYSDSRTLVLLSCSQHGGEAVSDGSSC
jgi:hypothetical protein